jgi:metal-responsive CopG/Arc/MetJ family transcriptional regulator
MRTFGRMNATAPSPKQEPGDRISISMPRSLVAELKRLAAAGNRPVSREAATAIEAHVRRHRTREPEARPS